MSDCCFNPRARAGRDYDDQDLRVLMTQFQSTRPRGARRACGVISSLRMTVSIHAPARGATTRASVPPYQNGFNPRARVGRDLSAAWQIMSVSCFNPRARAGRDAVVDHDSVRMIDVSIHAPARGATLLSMLRAQLVEFQSTRPRGARRLKRIATQLRS